MSNQIGAVTLLAVICCIAAVGAKRNIDILEESHTTGHWSPIADMTVGHTINSAAVVNDTLYLVGGTTGTGWNIPLAFHPTTDSWTTLPGMVKPRDHQTATTLNNKVYVLGGVGANANGTALEALKSVEAFDPEIRRWSSSADMPTSRYYLGAATLDGKMYVVGGMETAHTGSALSTAIVFDPATGRWDPIANMTTARSGSPGTVALNGKIYVVGGDNGDGPNSKDLNTAEVYDPSTGIWSPIANMSMGRNSMGAAVLNGKIYVMGGYGDGAVQKSVEMYDPETAIWSSVASMSTARHWPAATALNGKVYAIGGDNGNPRDPVVFKTAEAFEIV